MQSTPGALPPPAEGAPAPPHAAPVQPAPIVSASQPPPPLAGTANPGSDKHTMLGMPAVALPPPPARAQQPPPQPQQFPPALKTMMGVAIPGIAPTRENLPPEP